MTETGTQRFTGKVAFVTGSGIGRATALAFAGEGAAVAVTGIPEDDIRETEAACRERVRAGRG
jgi:NAD(P)-dependent dehydrogenase (short-subunit alcohol dehydrogenase family)